MDWFEHKDEDLCPNCGTPLIKYKEKYEAWGQVFYEEVVECPKCDN